jgi:hypothetical protein
MARKEPSAREMLKALETAMNVMSFFGAGPSARGWVSMVVMMALAIIGVVILFGALVAASLIVVVFGLDQGPYAWLGVGLTWTGFFGGLAAAAFVMMRIVRRRHRVVVLAGFADEPDDPADPTQSSILAAIAARGEIDTSRLRAIDARLASPTRPTAPDPGGPPNRPS